MSMDHLERPAPSYHTLSTFSLPAATNRKYGQYADLYFARLVLLKSHVERVGEQAWSDFSLAGIKAKRVDRVLDVRQGEVCWVVGTVFMDMPLKPSIMDDLAKENWIVAPPPRTKYFPDNASGEYCMLEDESGRLQLTGNMLSHFNLCTGCIIAVLGTENRDGAFDVIDIKVVDLPTQPPRWKLTKQPSNPGPTKIAVVSGLKFDAGSGDNLALDLLAEYLIGESAESAQQIVRLIIAGGSLSDANPVPKREESLKKYAQKDANEPAAWNLSPVKRFDAWLATVLPTLPVTLIPGELDPTNVGVPQQPLHSAFFAGSRKYLKAPNGPKDASPWFDNVTNPWDGEAEGWRILATGGQPINDMFKYVEGDDRLGMMESFLRWRNIAPTAPDTLWTYPYFDKDPFVIKECPHIFIAGGQPKFGTKVINGPAPQNAKVRLVAVPSFKETGQVVMLDTESLKVDCVRIKIGR